MEAAQILDRVVARFIGTKHERDVKKLQPLIASINAREAEMKALSDEELKLRFAEIKAQVQERLKDADPAEPTFRELMQQALEPAIVPAFALVREAGRRFLNMRHFDVQLIGGMVLHEGKIAEMKTGEGKTLVATLPAALNALAGRGVHIVTVNDYLARRDAEWMSPLYRALGLNVCVIVHDLDDEQRRAAYGADITYGTNNEFGFDYLRDNMKYDLAHCVQRGHHFAIVDEVDSILIDEARTPLIISGPSEESTDKYFKIDKIIPKLIRDIDYTIDEKHRQATLTEEGFNKCERLLGLTNMSDPANIDAMHHVYQALRAHTLYKIDVDYVNKDGKVVIVDEFTGRMMPGRRWSDGLHQAVEAKEGVKIERENQTLATITFQNYFRMYKKLAGMTGTADTEASEFGQIYNLDVTVIPTNQPMIREDRSDLVYRTADEKWDAVVHEIRDCHERGQPVLVGTVSIEKSEMLSKLLNRPPRVPHVVLNAKYHEREASIVAQAGRKGAVTIATNMAGRGTDIVLGGNPEGLARSEADPEKEPEAFRAALARYQEMWAKEREEVLAAGGLHILGTERHESRRIDNQLRGRSGRQGDPGSSRFYLSLEDDLMRIFGSDRIKGLMGRLGMIDGEPIEHSLVTRSIERAQKQVEGRNFEMRKHLLEYDDVMNKQREAIYQLRRDILEGREGRDYVMEVAGGILDSLIESHCPEKTDPQEWDLSGLRTEFLAFFNISINELGINLEDLGIDGLRETLGKTLEERYAERETRHPGEVIRAFERAIMLHAVDVAWKDHLLALDHLKEGIGLRGYGQRDPLQEYKRESFELFQAMKDRVEDDMIQKLFRYEPMTEEQLLEQRRRQERAAPRIELSAPPKTGDGGMSGAPGRPQQVVHREGKVGRNDPCPCGSGEKYKKCHGAAARLG